MVGLELLKLGQRVYLSHLLSQTAFMYFVSQYSAQTQPVFIVVCVTIIIVDFDAVFVLSLSCLFSL